LLCNITIFVIFAYNKELNTVENNKSIILNTDIVLHITAKEFEVVSAFLRIILAQHKLTDNHIKVATALVVRYAKLYQDNIKEPYASKLLFSSDNRKLIAKELLLGQAHLNNTFLALTTKNVLIKGGNSYILNPNIFPVKSLTFKFKVKDAK